MRRFPSSSRVRSSQCRSYRASFALINWARSPDHPFDLRRRPRETVTMPVAILILPYRGGRLRVECYVLEWSVLLKGVRHLILDQHLGDTPETRQVATASWGDAPAELA